MQRKAKVWIENGKQICVVDSLWGTLERVKGGNSRSMRRRHMDGGRADATLPPCFRESRTYLEFHNLTPFPRRAFVIFIAKDGGDILRDGYVDEVGCWFHLVSYLSRFFAVSIICFDPLYIEKFRCCGLIP